MKSGFKIVDFHVSLFFKRSNGWPNKVVYHEVTGCMLLIMNYHSNIEKQAMKQQNTL